MYNYNSSINSSLNNNTNNNKKENNEMNEIEMAYILNELDKSGVKVGFGNQVPAQLANGNKHYATGYMTGAIPTHMINNMFAQGAVGGVGLVIEGEKETPELLELVSYLSKNPRKGASLIKFCQNCLLAGNKPIKILEDGAEKYFLCANGKVLVRNDDEFTVNKCHEDEEEKKEYLSEALITEIQQELNDTEYKLHTQIKNLIAGIEKAKQNDDIIRKEALVDALKSCLKLYAQKEVCAIYFEKLVKEYQDRKKQGIQNDDWNF